MAFPKVGKTNALSNQVTSNSVPSSHESKVVKNDNVIAPGMFRIDPRKTSRENKFMPNHNIRASVRTNLITISQPHVISKKVVNSDSNGFSFTGVDIATKTRRPQPRSNIKNDRKCLIIANHDVCVLNYVNGMKSRGKKQEAKGSNIANQMKHKTQKFLGTVHFGNDHVAAIMGFGDLQWGNILITRVYFVESLGHNLFSVGQFCDSALETINLHDMASASPICLMARATSTKSWLWHQRLSHLNFDTMNDLSKNNLVTDLPKFKYHKEHLCPSCDKEKVKSLLTHPKQFQILSRASFVRTPQQNEVVERRNRTLVEAARTMLIFSRVPLFLCAEAIATACYTQNCSIIHRRFDKTPYELINGRKPNISFLYVFGALCYPKNDREDVGKLGAKGDIGFFIGYSANSCAYKVYNRRTKKIMETMNVIFDELLPMDFEQHSSKPELQSMTSGQISSGIDLT
ncbi:retrovirus-related pol polyprotein from transposon TNT 1-94 [Tanacetum coccineum]